MKEVRFAEYRRYEARRVEASNAMMALLAGAGMASHLLQLTHGSRHLLPEVFPQVPHIGRFNLRTEVARQILDAADTHLGAMSIPYALALHDDFLRGCIALLAIAGKCTAKEVTAARLAGRQAPTDRALHRRVVRRRQPRAADHHSADAQLHDPRRRPRRSNAAQRRGRLDTRHRGWLGQAHREQPPPAGLW